MGAGFPDNHFLGCEVAAEQIYLKPIPTSESRKTKKSMDLKKSYTVNRKIAIAVSVLIAVAVLGLGAVTAYSKAVSWTTDHLFVSGF